MKIALFGPATPFVRGGAEILTEDLKLQLEKRGHTVKYFRLPIYDDFSTGIFLNALCTQMLNFDDYDVLISFKWPAYLAVHKRKNLWMFHQLRQVYDMFGKPYGLTDDDHGKTIKEMVMQTDIAAFAKANKIYALSQAAVRLQDYLGITAEVLHTPLQNPEKYHTESTGDYIYCASRVDRMKRQLLIVEAMLYVRSGARLILDGKCGDRSLENEIEAMIEKNNLNDKVIVNNEFVPEQTKIDRYAGCLAGIYIPLDEDSPGLVSFEIMYSKKALITVNDSGGVAEFANGDHAFVTEPTPQAIAEKIDFLFENRDIAEKMGENAYNYVIGLNINWDDTIGRLLA